MKAMILAAGRGDRLRPLTDEIPKPLLKVASISLIEYHLQNLAGAGYKEVIVNTAWLAEKIHQQLGNGERYGVTIIYSDEGKALETAGGIINALPLLGNEPFLVVNGDIWCDFDFSSLPELKPEMQSHLILVNNPEHNPDGDFSLHNGLIKNTGESMHTFSGIGLYRPIIRNKCHHDLVSGELFAGRWTDVG